MNETLWSIDKMLEVTLKEPDDFLKVRETLSRIGVSSRKEKKLFCCEYYYYLQKNGLRCRIRRKMMMTRNVVRVVSHRLRMDLLPCIYYIRFGWRVLIYLMY